ncbi:ParB/RepB/Spo0J family partition protein [Streptosporangium longisporum]|uniref:ParB-like N-terminal domain-containing protein n=1 Tax=Streptosporangium longisporum TaxID=46187 RepID=A0ABP6KZG0_9ACTN
MTDTTTPAPTTTDTVKTVVMNIPLSRIERDVNQPREHFDEEKLNELALSIKKLGVLQPIAVRTSDADPKGRDRAGRKYTIIMGERRWRAAKLAGLDRIRCIVHFGVEDGDPETLAKAVAENVGRADMTPIEEAKGFQRLVDLGYPLEDVAAMCGKSASYVGWRIDLLKLDLSVQEAVMKGHITVGLAWYVANLSRDNQQRFLTRYVRGDFASTRDAEAFARACRTEEERQATQGSFFVLTEDAAAEAGAAGSPRQEGLYAQLPEEERERITRDRNALVGKIERLDTAGSILSELAAMDPEELALLLAGAPGGVAAQRLRVDHLKDVATKAVRNLREAQAVATARTSGLQVDPALANDSAAVSA